jgi:hypothetical protein
MRTGETDIRLPSIEEAEKLALAPRKSDEQLAREYAEMIDQMFIESDDLDIQACPPDRRFFRGDREAWVYEHGNVAELVFIRQSD